MSTLRTAPKITVLVTTYNHALFISDAFNSVLQQDYPDYEVLFSDDCSTDNTFDILQDLVARYQGPHRILLNRNPCNLGLMRHLNHCMTLASGDLIVNASGDDISLPNRVSALVAAYRHAERQPLLLHSRILEMSPDGTPEREGPIPIIDQGMTLTDLGRRFTSYQGCSGAWHRQLFDVFGPFQYGQTYEDLTLSFRAGLLDAFCFVNEPLVHYRVRVGLSFAKQAQHSGMAGAVRWRRRQTDIAADTLRQRLLDLDKIDLTPDLQRLQQHMRNDLLKLEAREAWMDGGLQGLLQGKATPVTKITTLLAELVFALKIRLKKAERLN